VFAVEGPGYVSAAAGAERRTYPRSAKDASLTRLRKSLEMSHGAGTKRTRTEQPDNAQNRPQTTGHDEFLIACPELQTRLGQKYCDEAGLLALFLAHGIVRRVRIIEVTVQPLGGDNFKIKLNAAAPSVGEAKAEIARTQGTLEARQELYKVAVRADGSAVREDDAEPEPLDDDFAELENGEMVAMAVKEPPLVWRTCDEEKVTLSEGGAVATKMAQEENEDTLNEDTLVTSGTALTAGKHYWEVVILNDPHNCVLVGVTRPNLNPTGNYAVRASTDGWFMLPSDGSLWGNGKEDEDAAGSIDGGDRVGVLLDLDEGSLRFFLNGVQHGAGYPAGSVTGPVVCAVQIYVPYTGVRLLPQDMGHALLQ
jgi:hypothetical protein